MTTIDVEMRHVGVGIGTTPMRDAVAWYVDHFGFAEAEHMRLDPATANVVFLDGPGVRLELFAFDAPSPLPAHRSQPGEDLRQGGISHLAFTVSDLIAGVDRLRAAGVTVVVPPTRSANGTMIAFINDACGNVIELVQPG